MPTTDSIHTAKVIPQRTETPRAAWPSKETYTVKSGDTLSEIVQEHLMSTGREVSSQSIYQGVQEVAKNNGISDPNRILSGQKINLSVSQERLASSFDDTLVETIALGKASTDLPSKTGVSTAYAQVLDGPATLSSTFGARKHPIHNRFHHHNGIDLAAEANTPITAMDDGTVSFSGWKPGHGNTIVVRHDNGVETQYSHAAKRLVELGERVTENSVLGLVGDTGMATGPHLHLEVKQYGRTVNPMPYLLNSAM